MALIIERGFDQAITITVAEIGELVIRVKKATSSNRVDLVITGPRAFNIGRLEKRSQHEDAAPAKS